MWLGEMCTWWGIIFEMWFGVILFILFNATLDSCDGTNGKVLKLSFSQNL